MAKTVHTILMAKTVHTILMAKTVHTISMAKTFILYLWINRSYYING